MIRSRSSLLVNPNLSASDESESEPSTPPGSSPPSSTAAPSTGIKCPNKCPTTRSTGATKQWKYLLLLLMFSVVTYLYIIVGDLSPAVDRSISNANDRQLTIVMNTFQRHDLMTDAIDHYKRCKLVGNFHIVWSEKTPPPTNLVAQYAMHSSPKIVFDVHTIDSLNNRFKPLNGSFTDAIFSVDDDMRVSCADLNLAYEVWKGSQHSLVGFMPRTHLRKNNQLVYRCWWTVWWRGSYSIILTKAAILHHNYFKVYTHKMPQVIRDYIDSKRNCEDIAMQYLMSEETNLPPIYVKGHLTDKGGLGGISTSKSAFRSAHMKDRSACLNDLVDLYKHNPLVGSHVVVDTASDVFANQPSTWMEYISSDLWNFF
jgi:hypothetical protein